MNILLKVILALTGATLGFFIAAAGTYYGCMMMDKIEGNTPGNGYMTVGWIFWFITIPIGTIFGGGFGVLVAKIIESKKKKNRDKLKRSI